MKSTLSPRFQRANKRLFLLTLVSLVAIAALLSFAVSANRANRAAKARAEQAANAKSAINPLVQEKQPNAPNAAVIVGTLTDNLPAATKVAPGGTLNYTATVTNNGAASPADDATNLNFSAPLDINTTLVGGSVHASPLAFNDTYNWVGNTQLDTVARALPAVTANDVAVNAPAGTDTFTLTPIAAGPTALVGSVTLAANGSFTYTPPVGRPNIADGATVQDSFTYTITNSADPTLTSTGTVRINLTGRVWYLVAGGVGDGRSNTPSGSPAAMSTAADKSTDIFYIFSGGGSLNGPFSVDAGQQLLGQGVNLVVSAITLFTATSNPTTTNTAGSCVSLAGAPGNNTLSGFNIGNCTGGTAITGANVGTLNVSTLSINTNGGALDLTGVGSPTVSVVLGGTTSTGGTKNVNLVGLNGTITLAGGALSGATNNAFDVNGGTAGITYSGAISNSTGRQVSIVSKTGGTVALSGAIGGTGTGIFLNSNTGATINFTGGITLSTGVNAAFTATAGGTVSATQNNTSIVNTLTTTTGTALNVANTTIGASGLTFRSISAGTGAGSAGIGIILDTTGATGGLTVTGNGGTCTFATPTCDGGTIQHKTGADSVNTYTSGLGIYLNSTSNVSLTRMHLHDFDNGGIRGRGTVNGFTLQTSVVDGANGTCNSAACDVEINNGEDSIRFTNLTGSALVDSCFIGGGFADNVRVINNTGTLNRLTISNSTIGDLDGAGGQRGLATNAQGGQDDLNFESKDGISVMNVTVSNNTLNYGVGDIVQASNNDNTAPIGTMDVVVRGNTIINSNAADQVNGASGITIAGLGTTTYEVACNKVANSKGIDVNLFKGHEPLATGIAANFTGTVFNNTIGLVGVSHSGGGAGATALNVDMQGRGTHTVLIKNNVIRQYGEAGIRLNNVDNNSTAATLNATVIGNTTVGVDADAFTGIFVVAGAAAGTDSSNITNLKLGGAGGERNDFTLGDPFNSADVFLQHGVPASTFNLSKGASVAVTADQVVKDNNIATITVFADAGINPVAGVPTLPPGINEACSPPPIPNPVDDNVRNGSGIVPLAAAVAQSQPVIAKQLSRETVKSAEAIAAVKQVASNTHNSSVIGKATPKASAAEVASIYRSERPISHHAVRKNAFSQEPNAPTAGENVTLNTIATFPAGGKSITIKYSATVNTTALTTRQATTQGTITANAGAINVVTTDPGPPAAGATVTLLDTTLTWTGATDTNWNTATNWSQPGPVVSSYAPGVSNPAVNDVIIPAVATQPTISATDIGIFSLSLANTMTLTITNPRVLTIGAPAPGVGGDLALNGVTTGGFLNFGTGSHNITNTGTGSLSSTNVATVLSGSIVTLSNDLQAGALAVNAGGSMTIANRILSLNGTGGLVVPGGATFTTTASTVIFNGTAAQQAAGIAYNNLTINNTAAGAPNALGATLAGNATINGVLALTSNDLNTGGFTLTQPNTTASTGAGDVVGAVARTGGPFGLISLTFGNPNNVITFTGAGTRPTTMTVVMAKAAPATYAAAVQRNFTINQTGGSLFTATVRLHYLDSELNGNTPETALGLRRLRAADSHWVAAPPPPGVPTRDGAANWIEATGVLAADLTTQWTFSTLVPTASDGVVTGRIVDQSGNPVEGAVVRLEGTQNRKFITDANGFYRFDNVATNGFYTVTPSRANFSFTPSVRSFSQLGESTEAAFGATLSTSTLANPLDTPEYFVRQHYVDFLNREPDEAGFNFWSDQIIECSTDQNCFERRRENVSAAFFLSIEFQRTGGLVDGVYRAAYGVRPDFAHFLPDTRTVGHGVQVGIDGWEALLATNTEAFVNSFVNRAEFHLAYDNLSDSQYVDALISHTGVSFTSAERDELLSGLGAGSMTRAQALRSIAGNSRFVSAKFNETFVMMEYFGYLRRDADASGFAFWLNKLNQFNGNFEQAEMVKAFIVSGEYRDRFPR